MQKRIIAILCSIPLALNLQLYFQREFSVEIKKENIEIEHSEMQLLYAKGVNLNNIEKEELNKAKEDYKKLWEEKLRLMKLADDEVQKKKQLEEKAKQIREITEEKKQQKQIKTKEIKKEENYEYFNVSHYCSCSECSDEWGSMTASGKQAIVGKTIAADSKYPFGTKIEIEGKVYEVMDRGGAIKGNKIDIYVDNHSEAMKRGRKTVKGKIIK